MRSGSARDLKSDDSSRFRSLYLNAELSKQLTECKLVPEILREAKHAMVGRRRRNKLMHRSVYQKWMPLKLPSPFCQARRSH